MKRFIGLITILSLVLLSIPVAPSQGASALLSVSDVISDSAPSATGVTHTFNFETQTVLSENQRVDITVADGFTNIVVDNVTCPTNTTESVTGQLVRCTVDAGQSLATGTHQVVVTNVTNPVKSAPEGVADTYQMELKTTSSDGGEVYDSGTAMVAIIEAVTVTATVDATLEFSVSGVDSGQSIKETTANATSSTTTIPFGTLPVGSAVVAAQDLKVATNAREGYSVVVFQDQNLTSGAGDEISCFVDGECHLYNASTTAWVSPSGTIDDTDTYGHFGFSSEDEGVAASCLDEGSYGSGYYGNKTDNLWAGLSGTNQAVVMCHTGPADGSTEHKGATRVGYRVEITALQAAGEYTNTLTYIATPTY